MKGHLLKTSTNKNALRTDSITGEFEEFPLLNKPFIIEGEPLNKAASFRRVITSLVKEFHIMNESEIVFITENSRYSLTYDPVEASQYLINNLWHPDESPFYFKHLLYDKPKSLMDALNKELHWKSINI